MSTDSNRIIRLGKCPWLIDFVNRKRGHWEKQEYYCYKCGERILKRDDACKCGKCDVTYKQHKETYYWNK